MVALSGAWFFALTSVFNRKLKPIHYSALMFYHGIIGSVGGAVLILVEGLIKGGEFRWYTAPQYFILFAVAVFDTIATTSVTIAYQSDSSGFVSLLGYAIILYGFLSDVFVFKEEIQTLQLVGALIIFGATFFVATVKLC